MNRPDRMSRYGFLPRRRRISNTQPSVIRVMFLIPALDPGGAERQLIQLLKGLDKARFTVTLATFRDGGALRKGAESLTGIRLVSLRKRGPWDVLPFVWRLWRAVSETRPDILHGYMGLASNLCLLVGRPAGATVVWSLRAANMNHAQYSWRLLWTFRAGAWLSRFADLIIVNSHAGREYHTARGYCAARMVVIPNGIDTQCFRPDPKARRRMRFSWDIGEQEVVIGIVGRLDAIKDHPTFLRAAAELASEMPTVRFVCVGPGPEVYAAQLQKLSKNLGLAERVIWAGALDDMPATYNALDILTSSSYGEGFSNVIAEAMACGVPCVVTDVGDSARIVGESGFVVPPRNPQALAEAWRQWLRLHEGEREARTVRARSRIECEFNLNTMIRRTESAMEELLMPARQP